MNREIQDIIKKHDLHPISYQKLKKALVINTKKKKYVVKTNTNNYDIYKYLSSRDFNYFPPNYNTRGGNYDLSLYIDDNSLNNEQKLSDLIGIIASLHKKTSFMRELDLDDIKKVYEELQDNIKKSFGYYSNLNDYIDSLIFYSPSEYLLVRNISLIYYLLEFSKKKLDDWYNRIKESKSIRNSLIHNNIDLDHLLINNGYYLVSWDKAMFSTPVDDLVDLYRKYYHQGELDNVLSNYNSINNLNQEEYDLLLIRLSIPDVIELTNDTYSDTKKINDLLFYLNKIYKIVKKNS